MNSKQLNFFILPEDLLEIHLFFSKNHILSFENSQFINNCIPDNDFFNYPKENTRRLFLTNVEFKKNIYFIKHPTQNTFYVDILRSYVIEFDLGGFYPYNSKSLHRGRLYYTKSYFGINDEKVTKSKDFEDWADGVIKYFKKVFLKKLPSEKWIYFSNNALSWVEAQSAKIDPAGLIITYE